MSHSLPEIQRLLILMSYNHLQASERMGGSSDWSCSIIVFINPATVTIAFSALLWHAKFPRIPRHISYMIDVTHWQVCQIIDTY